MAKILIVDDNEMNMRLFADLLKTQGHDIIELLDSQKAFDTISSQRPDLVLMDIQMPNVSGIEITKMVRNTPQIQTIPIVGISAFATQEEALKICKLGFDDFISKPIDIPSFFQKISKNLSQ